MRRLAACALTVTGLAGMAVPAAAQQSGEVTVEHDVVYRTVDGEELAADVYLPAEEGKNRPAVLIVHGGGWVAGDKAWFADQGNQLAEAGYVAVSVNYRLAPANPYPAAVDDVAAAVKWLRK
ncbi:MAG: alpha/beta hydrolase, partial [Actinomycetota bacterium]